MTAPTRRQVMRAFGFYLDWLHWANQVKRGEEDPPEGYDFGDMINASKGHEQAYLDAKSAYVRQTDEATQ